VAAAVTTQTYWLEPTDTVAVGLRRYHSDPTPDGVVPAWTCEMGYHAALAWTGEAPARFEEDGWRRHIALADDTPHNDPRWPTECGKGCGYQFTDDDRWQPWQDLLYLRPDTGQRYTIHPTGAPPGVARITPGASYDAWWYPDAWRGADGIALVVICPNGPHNEWGVDRPATGGGRWTRSGDPRRAEVTASPSIAVGDPAKPGYYHGFLQARVPDGSHRMNGGLRIGWLARLTRGRLGMGRWTPAEVAEIKRRAAAMAAEIRPYTD
jgi:hypothetical protein